MSFLRHETVYRKRGNRMANPSKSVSLPTMDTPTLTPLSLSPTDVPGCLAFWDFNRTLLSVQGGDLRLEPEHPNPEWVSGGIFGEACLRIGPKGSLRIPRAKLGPLNIFGPGAEVSLCVWLFRESDELWQALAGVWDESRSKRQYGMFLNARTRSESGSPERVPCANRIHGHISDVGGPTRGNNCCITYASGGSEIPMGTWVAAGMTAGPDGIRVYVDGRLDVCDRSNPFPMPGPIFDGEEDGADFTVGANSVRGGLDNRFGGRIGGLAVYNRALSAEEMRNLLSPCG
jgi:hypothetical protein